jgi:hypothetical protein
MGLSEHLKCILERLPLFGQESAHGETGLDVRDHFGRRAWRPGRQHSGLRSPYDPLMDWAGWAVFGLVATAALTAVMTTAQLAGLTRLDLPLVLGTLVTEDPDRARLAGSVIHLGVGQVFALGYALVFTLLGRATWWLGGLLGLLHVTMALMVLLPVLPGLHPRMASHRAGPASRAVLEPPGLMALNYGVQTPVVAVVAHLVYGVALGLLLQVR